MSRQDKATTERNARVLRDLVRQPDNKSCADCRTNDARWASWNLGVFLCIRCSGLHRAMGTHISKVKSIDLDIWTPEQMEMMQIWGNRRANLYWERHLKKGHVPPDHKIESFIRSKYESRRWALDGPPPRDPSVLEQGGAGASTSPPAPRSPPAATSTRPAPAASGARPHPLLSRQTAKPAAQTARPAPAAAAPIFDLFGDDTPAPAAASNATSPASGQPITATASAATPTAAAAPAQPPSNIFDLDFKAPAQAPKSQTNKADIMSLFSQAPSSQPASGGIFNASAPAPTQNNYGSWNGGITSSAAQTSPQANTAPVPTWGFGDQSAWGSSNQTAAPAQPQMNSWGAQAQPQQTNNSSLWGASSDPWASSGQPAQAAPAPKKDERDPFANIWG